MTPTFRIMLAICSFAVANVTIAADWNQWRGNNRSGFAQESPALVDKLPAKGMKPVWICSDTISETKGGGWSSPVVAGGKVYLFAHKKNKLSDSKLGPTKYPYLSPDKRVGMSDAEYEEYEDNRRNEQEARSAAFQYNETVYCLSAETGEKLWENQSKSVYTRFAQSGTPAVIDQRIFILGAGRVARCLSADDGKEIWRVKLPGEFRDQFMQSSFAIVDNVAVVRAGQLFGVDAITGKLLWNTNETDTNQLHSSPAIWRSNSKSYIVINAEGGETVCVDPSDGKELWRVDSQAKHSTPVVIGDVMLTYASSRKGGLRRYDLSVEGAKKTWTYTGAADSGACPVVVGDYVFVQGDRRLACVNLESGDAEWSTMLDLERPRYTSLIAADNLVIYAFDGVLAFEATAKEFRPLISAKVNKAGVMNSVEAFEEQLELDAMRKTSEGQKQAEKIWRSEFSGSGPLPCASPAIADGRLFLRLKNGVACYDLRKP